MKNNQRILYRAAIDRPLPWRLVIFLCVACALAVVSARANGFENRSGRGAPPADLEGREWGIAQYYVNEILMSPHREVVWTRQPYIAFENGTVKGSPGCGRWAGTYHRSDDRMTLSVEWADDKKTPCNRDEKEDAGQMLKVLTRVRRIQVEPKYWHSDSLLLTDDKGAIQIALSPMQTGKDLSELHDTFWHLTQLQGSNSNFSDGVIEISGGDITFSTPSWFSSFPFEYKLSGLEFFPAWSHSIAAKGEHTLPAQLVAKIFEKNLHKIYSYEPSQGRITFSDIHGNPLMVFSSLPKTGIENRRWRIAKYRGGDTQQKDEDGLTEATRPADVIFMNGRVEGSPGCGGWVGDYTLSGGKLTFQASAFLAGACYPEDDAQSHLVEKAFKRDMRIKQGNDRILLLDENGTPEILLLPF